MAWISVRNWRKFQHYDPAKRQPPWIKVYTELMSDDAFLVLSGHDRAVLICLWLEYASSRCQLRVDTVSTSSRSRLDTRSLSSRLNLRCTTATLERLNHAGWIDIVASKTLAEGYQDASARAHDVEVEVEEEVEEPFLPSYVDVHEEQEGRVSTRKKTEAEIVAERELGLEPEPTRNGRRDDNPAGVPMPQFEDIPF